MNFWKKEESNVKRGLGQILEAKRAVELAELANDPNTIFCPCCGEVMYENGVNSQKQQLWTCYEARCQGNIEKLWTAFQEHESGYGLYDEFFNQTLAGCLGEFSQTVRAFCKLRKDTRNDRTHVTVLCDSKDKDGAIIAIHAIGWTWMDWVPEKVIHDKG